MVNVIGYGRFPDKEEFITLYVNNGFTQAKLAAHYSCTKKRIQKWILHFGLSCRSQGGHRKPIEVSVGRIQSLIDSGKTYGEITKILGITRSLIQLRVKKFNIIRYRNIPEYQTYKTRVHALSNKTYSKNESKINPHKYKRTRCGIEGGYQLDHIFSIRECFDLGWSVEQCSDIRNLQLIPWKDNLNKRTRRMNHG